MGNIQVLAIAGVGRSGSTILETALGQHQDFFPIGEFAMLWGEMNHDFLCNCGESFFKCTFWKTVFDQATDGFQGIDPDEILKIRQAIDRNSLIPLIRTPALRPKGYDSKLNRFLEVLSKIYSSIHEQSGGKIILDSSKSPAYFHILSLIPDIKLTIIHLVRDSRAVAYSWQKKKKMTYSLDREQYIERQGTAEASVKWLAKNMVAHTLTSIAANYTVIRYEDFANNPKDIVRTIVTEMGKDPNKLAYLTGEAADLSETHGILGNPTPRAQTQTIQIRQDTDWQDKLNWLDKWIVLFLTWPLLLRYGYFSS